MDIQLLEHHLLEKIFAPLSYFDNFVKKKKKPVGLGG